MRCRHVVVFAVVVISGAVTPPLADAEENKPPKELAALKYRLVGP